MRITRLLNNTLMLSMLSICFMDLPTKTLIANAYKDTVIVYEGDTLKVSWDKPKTSDPVVRSYRLIFIDVNIRDVTSFLILDWQEEFDRRYYIVNIELPRYGDYEVFLVARNNAGDSEPSEKYFVRFVESSPGSPKNFVIVVIKRKF